jgi:beta-N-acetylhexosaminidase
MVRAGPRRRLALAAAVAVAAGGGGVGTALLVDSEGGDGLSPRERRQLEAAGATGAGGRAAAALERAAARMPLARQAAQLFAVGTAAKGPRDAFFDRLRSRGWGIVVLARENFVAAEQVRELAARAASTRAAGVVPLVAAAQPGGPGTALPGFPPRAQPVIGLAGDPAMAREQALASARNLRALGVRMTLAPVADVAATAGPLEVESFGRDPALVTRLTRAAVEGYRAGRVIPAVGHFPGQGGAAEDPDVGTGSVSLSLLELRTRDLSPFAAVVRRTPAIVTSNAVYAAFDGVTPASLLPEAIGGLLRRDLRFRGVAMTDDLRSAAPVLGIGVGAAAVRALEAGADVLQVSGGPVEQDAALRAVVQAVRSGRISHRRLRVSLLRVLALKRSQGLVAR